MNKSWEKYGIHAVKAYISYWAQEQSRLRTWARKRTTWCISNMQMESKQYSMYCTAPKRKFSAGWKDDPDRSSPRHFQYVQNTACRFHKIRSNQKISLSTRRNHRNVPNDNRRYQIKGTWREANFTLRNLGGEKWKRLSSTRTTLPIVLFRI